MIRKSKIHRRVAAPGCDDAPVVTVEQGTEPKPITLVMPYYENPQMFQRHLDHWVSFRLLDHLSFIIVDDGSPEHPASSAYLDGGLYFTQLRIFRIDMDIRWNWLAARNLAMHHASDGWCLLTDMDHVVPEPVVHSLIYGKHDPAIVYRFGREEHDGQRIAPHPNSWFMTRGMFWKIGGYDEALSGYYGTDGEFRRRVAAMAPVRILTDRLVRHEFLLDASTTRYRRKEPIDCAVSRIVSQRGPDWKPKVLSFPWHAVRL